MTVSPTAISHPPVDSTQAFSVTSLRPPASFRYMLAENSCFFQNNLLLSAMVDAGKFGEVQAVQPPPNALLVLCTAFQRARDPD